MIWFVGGNVWVVSKQDQIRELLGAREVSLEQEDVSHADESAQTNDVSADSQTRSR